MGTQSKKSLPRDELDRILHAGSGDREVESLVITVGPEGLTLSWDFDVMEQVTSGYFVSILDFITSGDFYSIDAIDDLATIAKRPPNSPNNPMSTTADRLRAQFPDVNYVKLTAASEKPEYRYPGFRPGREIIPKGHIRESGHRAFHTDVIFERDVSVPMRDGITIYTDIFRPVDSERNQVPAILPWSPYGKTGSGIYRYEDQGPFSCGVPKEATTGYEKFEAPDPAEWCPRGYAIINIDARGAGMSEGNTVWWGQQEAEDIYDTIEWLSHQPWCNGSVVMAGNSWLAIAQINFASRLSHPALKAIAPFEGINDPYRDGMVRGGILSKGWIAFHQSITSGFAGPGYAEDIGGAALGRPLYDDYWRSKNINTANIDIPLYATASYSATGFHLDGSIKTWRNAKSKEKWLRIHSHQEWYDLYRPEVTEDLQKFFDRYSKNIDNGWEDTPPIRLSLLGMDGSPAPTIIDRPEKEYPLARQKLVKYYLDASNQSLSLDASASTSEASYEAHSLTAASGFVLRFQEYTELAGYPKVTLWMSCAEKDDLDVGVVVRKLDSAGELMTSLNYPCPVPHHEVTTTMISKSYGSEGFLRASHTVSRDDSLSSDDGQEVFYHHDRREPVPPGTRVRLEFTIRPIGMVFEKGEGLLLSVAGHSQALLSFVGLEPKEPTDDNLGLHTIYTGGEYDSNLIIPMI